MDESSSKPSTTTVEQAQAEPPPLPPPHEALLLVLAYLPVWELLAMSQVCKSLRDAVNNDVLPWLNLIVENPLSSKLSDEILMKLTSKANGRLRTLALINCFKISDYGLQRVVEENPFISKLYIPSCTSITPEGVLRAAKTLCQGSHSLSILRINGIQNLTKEHLDVLTSCLRNNLPLKEKPIYYHKRSNFLAFKHGEENPQPIDLEICSKCSEVRMVYDCPKEGCKNRSLELNLAQCRGCHYCIPRCENCGGCLESQETEEESACGDVLCLGCWLKVPKCSFCNKPYCKQHTNLWCSFPDSGFICKACDEESLGYMSTNDVL